MPTARHGSRLRTDGPSGSGARATRSRKPRRWSALPSDPRLRHRPARSAVDRVVRDAAANANARERFEDLAFRNTLTNLPALLREADAGCLAGAFSGRPAIVVGAGPSLDTNVDALRPFQSSCLIVA